MKTKILDINLFLIIKIVKDHKIIKLFHKVKIRRNPARPLLD